MICVTCNIPCNTICPLCLESVFSEWHNTNFAKEFGKNITEETREMYRNRYIERSENNVKTKKSFFQKIFN